MGLWRNRVELNKHATRSYDLVFSEGITFFGPKSDITSSFLAPTGKMVSSSTVSAAGKLNPMRRECRSANIVRDHAMILLDQANPKPDGIFGKHREGERGKEAAREGRP